MRVYLFGNRDHQKDRIAFDVAEKIKTDFPTIEFREVSPNQDLPFAGKDSVVIMDVVINTDKPIVVTEKDTGLIMSPTSTTVHDYDLGFQLKYLIKIGKLAHFTIIGIPPFEKFDYPSIHSIFKKLVAHDMHGS